MSFETHKDIQGLDAIRKDRIYSVTLGFIETGFIRFTTLKAFGEKFYAINSVWEHNMYFPGKKPECETVRILLLYV